jgi:hypothetical protein
LLDETERRPPPALHRLRPLALETFLSHNDLLILFEFHGDQEEENESEDDHEERDHLLDATRGL